MNKFVIFREMLDYLTQICDVTDADLNYCSGNHMRIAGETEEQTITFDIYINNKEVTQDGN